MTPLPAPQQLRYLLALAEHQHFGRAADACAVTQSTLSAGILALERQLDCHILDRDGGKRVSFTALGTDLLARARAAMAALTAVVETADAARSPMTGPLRLGVIPTIGPFLLPRMMPALRAAFPNLRLYLREDTTERLLERMNGGALDVALLALPCACGGADTLGFARDEFVAALPPNHRLAGAQSLPVEALAGERLLLLEDGHCLRDQALAACGFGRGETPADRAGLPSGLLDGFAATSLHTLVQMVAGGLGVTLLPRLAVDAGIARGSGTVLVKLTGVGASRMLGLAWRPKSPRAAEYRAIGPVLTRAVGEGRALAELD